MSAFANNVIVFPGANKGGKTLTPTEVTSNVNALKYNHINEALETIIAMLFNNIEIAGFGENIGGTDDSSLKQGSLIVESIRSLLMYDYGLTHPFKELADKVFVKDIEGFGLAPSVEMTFVKTEEDVE